MSEEPGRSKGRGLVDCRLVEAPVVLLLAAPGQLFCFGSLVVLGVMCCYLWLFLLDVDIKIGMDGC